MLNNFNFDLSQISGIQEIEDCDAESHSGGAGFSYNLHNNSAGIDIGAGYVPGKWHSVALEDIDRIGFENHDGNTQYFAVRGTTTDYDPTPALVRIFTLGQRERTALDTTGFRDGVHIGQGNTRNEAINNANRARAEHTAFGNF